jgi:hypothetical protein
MTIFKYKIYFYFFLCLASKDPDVLYLTLSIIHFVITREQKKNENLRPLLETIAYLATHHIVWYIRQAACVSFCYINIEQKMQNFEVNFTSYC